MYEVKGPFTEVNEYGIKINGVIYRIETLVSMDRVIAWTHRNGNGELPINPQFKDYDLEEPVFIHEVSAHDIAKLLKEVFSIKAKERDTVLEVILVQHSGLIEKMLGDFKSYPI